IKHPMGLRHLERQGSIVMLVKVGADGRATDSIIETSSGVAKLDDIVVKALSRKEFALWLVDGEPVERWEWVKWTFALQ
ncbi:MAG TPA: TonB family protein, partial [Casimicrobiaceae bacterium]|nr:TonB family protein [Casimicrobiaceae bacterium]